MSPDPGYLIRPAQQVDAEAISMVHIRTWQHAYADIFPPERLIELSDTYSARADHWREYLVYSESLPVVYVAETAGAGVVGFAGAGKQTDPAYGYDGELYVLYILPDFQRMGIGRALFWAAAAALYREGFDSLLLWALVQNRSAQKFYESVGGKVVGERSYVRWGANYLLVGYAWENLAHLAAVADEG